MDTFQHKRSNLEKSKNSTCDTNSTDETFNDKGRSVMSLDKIELDHSMIKCCTTDPISSHRYTCVCVES